MTPRIRSAAVREASLLSAPRSLNEFVTCRFSYLTLTEAPVSAESLGAGSMGVRRTRPAMVLRAASMSASVIAIPYLLTRLTSSTAQSPRHRRVPTGGQLARASCVRTVSSPPAGGFEEEGSHERRRTTTNRRVNRAQAARLRPLRQPRAVRRCAVTPGDCLHHRR